MHGADCVLVVGTGTFLVKGWLSRKFPRLVGVVDRAMKREEH